MRIVIGVIMLLLIGAAWLGIISAREMKRLISEDFNAQQLALARHAASILEINFKIIKDELLTLSLSPSIQYVESVSWFNRMKISLSGAREYGVYRIMLINADGTRSYAADRHQITAEENFYVPETEYLDWCREAGNKGKIFIDPVRNGAVDRREPALVMELAKPVYQVSPDEAHPIPTGKFAGVLVFYLDVGMLTERFVGPIRSGKTGYAWVMDETGKFLYHLEEKFVGQNAFEARQQEDPHISFTKINFIQQEKMLRGEEGTSWYVSGWHRGKIGSIRKLIAFAPVHIGAANAERTWSVAVVAPVSEVQEAASRVYFRQGAIQVVIGLIILVILLFFRANERMWVRRLEQEVTEKTTDLADTTRRLQQSEERYRLLVESADDLIFALDSSCRIQSVSQSYSRLTGEGTDSAVGRPLWEILGDTSPTRLCENVERVLASGRSITEEQWVDIKGRKYWLDTKYTRVTAAGSGETAGSAPTVMVVARDITESKQIEAQLFNTQKLASLGELSAGIAHEINNPIAIILGFTEILLGKSAPDAKEYEILKAIERQGNSCKRIVENLLAFARVPSHETGDIDVATGLARTISVVKNTMLTRKIELTTDIPDNLPAVSGNTQELEQVFLNIITNAVAAMKGGGSLHISASHSDNNIQIHFRDTGEGIPDENLDKIFEPFFTTKEVGEGTGLGLSVSYGIVKKLGGEILVHSRPATQFEESGTVFTVDLPVSNHSTA
jgi:PAS domain S-box-containing protein